MVVTMLVLLILVYSWAAYSRANTGAGAWFCCTWAMGDVDAPLGGADWREDLDACCSIQMRPEGALVKASPAVTGHTSHTQKSKPCHIPQAL